MDNGKLMKRKTIWNVQAYMKYYDFIKLNNKIQYITKQRLTTIYNSSHKLQEFSNFNKGRIEQLLVFSVISLSQLILHAVQ